MCCVWVYWTTAHLKGTKEGNSAAVEQATAEMLNCMQTHTIYQLGICHAVILSRGALFQCSCSPVLLRYNSNFAVVEIAFLPSRN